MPSEPKPSVRSRRIGRALKRLRDEQHLDIRTAARYLDRSAASLSTIENGLQAIRPRDLKFILDVYEVPEGPLRRSLVHLAGSARNKAWAHRFENKISPAAVDNASLEADSTEIRTYQPTVVPGLLQTEDYVVGVIDNGLPREGRNIEILVDFRLARQQILASSEPPHVKAVIGEAALRQQVGGPAVMRAQIDRLIEVADLDNVSIRVLPFSAGGLIGATGSFDVFTLRGPGQMTVVMVEDLTQLTFRDEPEDVAVYLDVFDWLKGAALDETATLTFMEQLRSGT